MCENDESRSFMPRVQNAGLRLEGSVRKDRDIAHIQAVAVNDEETLAARRGLYDRVESHGSRDAGCSEL